MADQTNTVRLTSVLLFAEFAGPQFAMDSLVHGGSDVIVYLAALIFMWLLIDAVSERRLLAILLGRDEDGRGQDDDAGGRREEARVVAADADTKAEQNPADPTRLPLESVCK